MGVLTKLFYIMIFFLIFGLIFYDHVWWANHIIKIERVGIEGQTFGKVINISEDHFYLRTVSSNIRIDSLGMPKVRKAKYGETVVHVIYREKGVVEGVDYHNYDYNYILYVVSFFSLFVLLFVFFKEWKLTLRGFEDA